MSNPWVQPDPCGLDLCDGLGWIFFYPPWWVGSKNPLNPTHAHPYSWYVYDLPVLLLTIKFWSPIMIDSISDFRWEALTSKVADVPLHQTPIYQTWKLVHGWQVHDAKIFLSNWSYNTVLQLLLPHAHFRRVIWKSLPISTILSYLRRCLMYRIMQFSSYNVWVSYYYKIYT